MRFSIIVPVFNTAAYLKECIESVQNQTFTDWELILVDDGSTDRSGAIIDEYASADMRIKALHQRNLGAFRARKTGISQAAGEYLLFLDADDRMESGCLVSVDKAITDNDPDIIMFVGKIYRKGIDTGDRFGKLGESSEDINPEFLKKSLISSHALNSLCNKAFRKKLFDDDYSDYSDLPIRTVGEDKIQQLLPACRARSIRYIPDELYIYDSREDSTINSMNFEFAEVFLANEMFSYLHAFMRNNHLTDQHSTEAIYVYYLRNFMDVYYRLRRYCRLHGKMRAFHKYEWEKLDFEAFRYSRSSLLTVKEKVKLFAARLHL